MPELPEVETTVNGIRPYIEGKNIQRLIVRDRRLRWPVPTGLEKKLAGQPVCVLYRRGKYIIAELPNGSFMVHLGMSGSMRVVMDNSPAEKHDHFDLVVKDGEIIRYRDPRRFGSLLWTGLKPNEHPLIASMGVEPLEDEFDANYLVQAAKGRSVAVKNLIMNGQIVVGVGNIYASESLYLAGIHPARASNNISAIRYSRLVIAIKQVLSKAIEQGGTTLQDFVNVDGKAGYFEQALNVYGRQGQPCNQCGTEIKSVVLGQRTTFYCWRCQK